MTKFVFNSIKALSMCSITAFMFACSQEDTVRFDQSFGFSTNGLSLKDFQGFLPSKFSIEDIDAFGAAYYNGTWKGIRIKK